MGNRQPRARTKSAAPIDFYQELKPTVAPGRYQVTVEQTITGMGTDNDAGATSYFTPRKQEFEVRAARFVLASDQIHGSFPPEGSTGVYDQILPHVSIDRVGLPWEIALGATSDAGTPSWLAVLLFAPHELPGDPEAVGKTRNGKVESLLTDPAVAPHDMTIEADEKEVTCATVDVPFDLFLSLAPTLDDLRRLAHIRQGGDGHQSIQPTASTDQPADRHAVIVGNRFPAETGGQYVAHLVSLEGYGSYLPQPDRTQSVGGKKPDGRTILRLVSLRHWSFRSLPDTNTSFGALVDRLAGPGRTDGKPNDGDALALRVPCGVKPPEGARRVAWESLRRGHVPVSYRLPSGDQTFAWYRGPLTPTPAQPIPTLTIPTYSADGWLVYQEKYGLYDVGYACAWTLGRLLALSDPAFCAALMRWQTAARRHAGRFGGTPGGGHGSAVAGGPISPHAGHGRLREVVRDNARKLPESISFPLQLPPAPPPPKPLTSKQKRDLRDAAHRHPTVTDKATPVVSRLRELGLLHRVPLDHLIPDPRMLPTEAIRFGYVDRNWQRALLAGALSVGVSSNWDADLTVLLEAAMAKLPVRMSGLLVRSALVPAWPALRVGLFQERKRLTAVRTDVLGKDLLLILVDGVVDTLTLAEPPQGLHFGYEPTSDGAGSIALRRLVAGGGAGIGEQISINGEYQLLTGINSKTYLTDRRVLDVTRLATNLGARIHQLGAGGPLVTSPGLAVNLVKAAEKITFSRQGA